MKYKVNWDNGTEACGTFPYIFDTEAAANKWAREWKRGMVMMEPTAKEQRVARASYQWEVIEIEDSDVADQDSEGWADSPKPDWSTR